MLESPCLSQETGRWDPRTDYRCFAGCFRARAPALMKPDADSTVRVRDSQQPGLDSPEQGPHAPEEEDSRPLGLDSPEQGPHAPEEEDSQRPARAYSLPILRPQLEDLVERDLCRDLSPR
jgi:hypothetical protein